MTQYTDKQAKQFASQAGRGNLRALKTLLDAMIDNEVSSEGAGGVATNTAYGDTALDSNTTGANNVAIGYNALTANTIGADNVAVGSGALDANTTGVENVAIGTAALGANTIGTQNIAIGDDALLVNTTGVENIAIGRDALVANTIGTQNVGIGDGALKANTTGVDNVAVGADALDANTIGVENIAIGTDALGANTTGTQNVAIGDDALLVNTVGTTTVAIGRDALKAQTTATGNVAVGDSAGAAVTTGVDNILIGRAANVTSATGAGQFVIGVAVNNTEVNQCVIGNSSGEIRVEFDADGTWSQVSDGRKKTDVKDVELGMAFVRALRPVTYRLRPPEEWPQEWFPEGEPLPEIDTEKRMMGLIAQDVKAALDKLGHTDRFPGWGEEANGKQRITKDEYVMPLIVAVKELDARLASIEGKSVRHLA